jgi:Arc/MetJ-type ribon-helix-helix transcriptional regulator
MANISVPLTPKVEQALDELVEITGANRSAVIRKAIEMYREDEAVNAVLRAHNEYRSGKGLTGDLDELLAAI